MAAQPTDSLWSFVEAVRRATPSSWRTSAQTAPQPATGGPTPEPTSAFITWAHRNSGWRDGDERAWQEQVAKFAVTLRTNGIDADVDLFHLEDPATDWTRFGPTRIDACDFALIVMSQAWSERWEGRNDPRVGAGAVGEADELRGLFQRDQAEWQARTLVVLFPDVDAAVVPPSLARLNRFSLDPYDLATYEPLLRTLTSQPQFAMPDLGPVPTFPERGIRETHEAAAAAWLKRATEQWKGTGRSDAAARPEGGKVSIGRDALIQAVIDALRES